MKYNGLGYWKEIYPKNKHDCLCEFNFIDFSKLMILHELLPEYKIPYRMDDPSIPLYQEDKSDYLLSQPVIIWNMIFEFRGIEEREFFVKGKKTKGNLGIYDFKKFVI
jgi:hypothetical protein